MKITKEELLLQTKRNWNRENNLSINIVEVQDFDSDILKFGINWGALGPVSAKRGLEFSVKLNECVMLIEGMNIESNNRNENEDTEITEFNKEMSREERNYYGRKFDESR